MADPAYPPLGYWRGYVWSPIAQLTHWSLQIYDHVPAGQKEIGGSGGSLKPHGPLLMHLHTVYMAYPECLPTGLNPLAERTVFPFLCSI